MDEEKMYGGCQMSYQ